jgi:hypothetical protein
MDYFKLKEMIQPPNRTSVPLGARRAHFDWSFHDGTSIPDLEVDGWKVKS